MIFISFIMVKMYLTNYNIQNYFDSDKKTRQLLQIYMLTFCQEILVIKSLVVMVLLNEENVFITQGNGVFV